MARGRAASPVRIGYIIKGALQGSIPLKTGELVREAAIVDVFGAYKGEVERINSLREGNGKIKGMAWASFYTAFRFARVLNLVELVREEPMLYPPPVGNLLRVEGTGVNAVVVISTRKIFRLTTAGESEIRCWSDLTRAYKEGWLPGRPLEVPVVPAPPPPVAPPPERVVPVEFKPYKWSEVPSMTRFKSLLKHLINMYSLGIEHPGVSDEAILLSMQMGDWVINAQDSLAEAESIGATKQITKQKRRANLFKGISDALHGKEIYEAIEMLKALIQSEGG